MFYANNGIVVSSDPAWLQGAFRALVAILDRVVLVQTHGLSPLSGGDRQPDHGGIQAETDGGREFIQGKTERESGVRGVWDSNSGWIHVKSHDESTWEGRNTATPLGPPDSWGAQVVPTLVQVCSCADR